MNSHANAAATVIITVNGFKPNLLTTPDADKF